jgi:hypothetical protein
MSEEADADPQRGTASTRRTGEAGTDEPRQIRLKPGAIAGGAVVAYIVSVALGIVLARTGIGYSYYLLPLAQFIALYAGGYFAGRWAGTSGFMNGVVVAVLWIVVWAVQNAMYEAQLVQDAGPAALPRMNMGGIIIGDLLNLSAAAFGGWMAERRR